MNLEQIKSKQLESDIASLHGMHTFQKRPGNRPLKEQTRPTDIAFLSAKLSQAERISGDLKNKLKNVVRERDSLSKDLLSRPSSGSFDDLVLSLSLSPSLSTHTHTHTRARARAHAHTQNQRLREVQQQLAARANGPSVARSKLAQFVNNDFESDMLGVEHDFESDILGVIKLLESTHVNLTEIKASISQKSFI